MLPELRHRVRKAGQPPGTPMYTGEQQTGTSQITMVCYGNEYFHETTSTSLADCLAQENTQKLTWMAIEGLHNTALIEEVASHYNLHPLTVEDILNVEQRAKIEEFDNYLFVTMKMLFWNKHSQHIAIEQLSLVIGENFVLSFQERKTTLFNAIYERLRIGPTQRLREKGSDYLAYRLLDAVIDQYFVVLEGVSDQIENLEERIIANPTPENSRSLHRLKHKMLVLRKAIWPMREIISHLLQIDSTLITPFTRLYIRDIYDHTVQAIDTIETFRDMLASILDVYLSTLSNRMNEIMKVLTIIATIFIPITFIASIFGMNFTHMPELQWQWGYPCALGLMAVVSLIMLGYFRRKKWL